MKSGSRQLGKRAALSAAIASGEINLLQAALANAEQANLQASAAVGCDLHGRCGEPGDEGP